MHHQSCSNSWVKRQSDNRNRYKHFFFKHENTGAPFHDSLSWRAFVVLYSVVHMKTHIYEGWWNLVSSNLTYFLTFTNLGDHWMRRKWMLDCWFWKVTKINGHIPPHSNIKKVWWDWVNKAVWLPDKMFCHPIRIGLSVIILEKNNSTSISVVTSPWLMFSNISSCWYQASIKMLNQLLAHFNICADKPKRCMTLYALESWSTEAVCEMLQI